MLAIVVAVVARISTDVAKATNYASRSRSFRPIYSTLVHAFGIVGVYAVSQLK